MDYPKFSLHLFAGAGGGLLADITGRRDNRPARVMEIGNGQYPLTAAVAFGWGRAVLEAVPTF